MSASKKKNKRFAAPRRSGAAKAVALPERARTPEMAVEVERGHQRLQNLYEIAKPLRWLDNVEQTVPVILAEVERAHRRLQRLYDISKRLLCFQTDEATVPEVLALVDQSVPLRVAILTLENQSEGGPRRVMTWHSEGISEAKLRVAMTRAKKVYGSLVQRGDIWGAEEVTGASVPLFARTIWPLADNEEVLNFVVLPLVVDHLAIFGAVYLEAGTRIGEADLVFLNAVVNQLAIALDRSAMVAARQEKAEARRAAAEALAVAAQHNEQTQRFLADTGALLLSSLECDKTVRAVVRAAVPLLADMCFIDFVNEGEQKQRVDVVLTDPVQQDLADQIWHLLQDPEGQFPAAQVLRTGKSAFLGQVASIATVVQDPAQAEFLKQTGLQSIISVPLVARGGLRGALTFVAAGSRRPFLAEDVALAEEVGRRAALAIDNSRLYEQAQAATRTREHLLAVVSHDLKNPLSVILMNSSMMERAWKGEDRRKSARQVRNIRYSAERMNRLVEDLLDIASIDAGCLCIVHRPLAAGPLIEDTIEMMQPLAATKSLSLRSDLAPALPVILADRGRLQQILVNLLTNAIKFTPHDGTITVEARREGTFVQFSVTDTGCGIPKAHLPHLFDRFWQAPLTARQGTGLGLSIVKAIVLAHGGRLWVESRLGVGSTFFFTLPVAQYDVDETAQCMDIGQAPAATSLRLHL